MSAIDKNTVRYVATLARLRLSEAEIDRMAGELSAIVSYVWQLNEVDTTNVPPTAHPLPVTNVFREDIIRPGVDAEEALRNAPEAHGDFFRVPKVLDQEEA